MVTTASSWQSIRRGGGDHSVVLSWHLIRYLLSGLS
jgi:hypothetical protein